MMVVPGSLGRLGAIASVIAQQYGSFTPASLFTPGVNGVWYDPSDFSTLFQDAAGTTPVTAVEQPVGLMLDKSKGLVLGPELVTNGDFSQGTTGWNTSNASGDGAVSVSNGTMTLSSSKNYPADRASARQVFNLSAGTYEISGDVIAKDVSFFWYLIGTASGDSNISGINYSPGVGSFRRFITVPTSGNIWFELRVSGTLTIDNISVRELPGNHAYNPNGNSANFPVLSARYNLLTKTEQFDDAAWVKAGASAANTTAIADPLGGTTVDKLTEDTSSARHQAYQTFNVTSGTTPYTFNLYIKAAERTKAEIRLSANTPSYNAVLGNIDLAAKTISVTLSGAASVIASFITEIGNGWFLCSVSGYTNQTGQHLVSVCPEDASGASVYAGDGTSGIYIWGADLRVANDALNQPAYQRVNTAADYDTVGFKPYLSFNGVNQWLQTNSIDFTYGDKMFVSAGVRKLSDSIQVIHEFGNWNSPLAGMFGGYISGTTYGTELRLQSLTFATAGTYTSPVTNINSWQYDTTQSSGSLEQKLRVNSEAKTINPADAGTGNFGNYPLYIGARGGSSLWFNGCLYGLVVAGKQASASEITSTETYLNQKTGAF